VTTLTRYAYAQLPGRDLLAVRLSGAGLGNLLVPWARSLIAARRYSLTLVTPTWPQIKIGPLLRREPDKRLYLRVFGPLPGEVHGARKLITLTRAHRVPESALATPASVPSDSVVVFGGISAHTLLGSDRLISAALWAMTRPALRTGVPAKQVGAIAVHVRLGDFRPPLRGDAPAANTRIALSWYVEKLRQLRAELGADLPAAVFSDGRDGELQPLLRLPRCRRVSHGPAISDLLAMSRYAALIASRSSFSVMSAYVGQVPTVWPPMDQLPRLHRDRDAEIESPAGERLPGAFITLAGRRLDSCPSLDA